MMVETRSADASIRLIETVAAVVGMAATAGVVYWCDRAYRRWWERNHPLAGHRARVHRLKTGFEEKRSNAAEVARFIIDILAEVPRT
jgi:hypothetical protein